MNILITGIAGSCGSYLAEYILENYPETKVHGLARWHNGGWSNLVGISNRITIHEVDLMDFDSVDSIIQKVNPDVIFHMASQANVGLSFTTPSDTLRNNVVGTSNLFEAVRLAGIDPIIVLASTSEVYGQVDPKNVPIKEDVPIQPANPYGVSKVAQDLLGQVYFTSYGMRIIRIRMFAYINPRRANLFATSFARQIVCIEHSLQKELLHGNLDSVRTIIDVRDAVDIYWQASVKCQPGEVYNVGGTTPIAVGEVLKNLISLSNVHIPTSRSLGLIRPTDVTLQIPCVEKFVEVTGWKPTYTLNDSLLNLLAYWREKIQAIKS